MARRDESSEGFLQRWSRRKTAPDADEAETQTEQQPSSTDSSPDDQQPSSEHIDAAQEKPIWQRDDADPAERRQALRDLFQQSKFNQTDGLEEYENDYNYQKFAKLGGIVTHEMRRFIEPRTTPSEPQQSDKDIHDESVNNDSEPPQDDEDNRLG